MRPVAPEQLVRGIIEECADCDICRFLMDGVCYFFPALYRLWDREMTEGIPANARELRNLVELCHFCALCPCEPVRNRILQAKILFVERDGLDPRNRIMEDMALTARLFRILRVFTNKCKRYDSFAKKILRIHNTRLLPHWSACPFPTEVTFPGFENFSVKAERRRKVAYFTGCTGRYIFPEVPYSVVKILNSLGYDVLVPKQLCCGMPALLEGDIQRVQSWISQNMEHLIPLVHAGYDIVCSCPTCSFMLRYVIPSGAMYHSEVQEKIRSNTEELMVPLTRRTNRFISVKRSLYEKIMGEDELFPDIPASERLLLANHVFDLGEFLLPSVDFLPSGCTVSASNHRFVYFAPCHQREQKIGRPYVRLLQHMGFEKLQEFPDTMYCCGQGGIMGFKSHYHEISTRIGMRLVEKIKPLNPDIIVTECLSCAIQLSQLTSYRVIHPALLIAACLE